MVLKKLDLDSLRFANDPATLCDDDTLLCRVPEQISRKSSLMLWFQASLKFPRGVGRSWDALEDSLRHHLEEIDCHRIVLFHEDIPLLGNVRDCLFYLDVLNASVKFWEKYPEHEFVVSFSCKCRSTIVELLKHPLVEQRSLWKEDSDLATVGRKMIAGIASATTGIS